MTHSVTCRTEILTADGTAAFVEHECVVSEDGILHFTNDLYLHTAVQDSGLKIRLLNAPRRVRSINPHVDKRWRLIHAQGGV